ncbi:PPC domain-containing DNA-binding protein [Rathayibacter sp. KR2-224]|uniref:PPC domain-containing DNA-binding protein n=1 Tax=Rathayibacter sp. KR2-224 TaxID=3400913 RepID=UPI003BFB2661
MQYKQVGEDPRRFAVIFETGDELLGGLGAFVNEQGIESASFTAIGALSSVRLAWFDWEAKQYRVSVELEEQVELVSLVGDVAENDGKPEVHAHVVIARSSGDALGGHLRHAIIRPTCEVVLTETEEQLRKRVDPESGLPLIRVDAVG